MPDQPTARQVIAAAVAAAGGVSKAAEQLGIASPAISGWLARGTVPAQRIKPLCDLGRNVVTPEQILEAVSREASQKAAA